jgi:hypothetical protein
MRRDRMQSARRGALCKEAALTAAGVACVLFAASTLADPVVPIVDYHQYLLSPAGAELQNRLLPAVALPSPLARLIGERAARRNDSRVPLLP